MSQLLADRPRVSDLRGSSAAPSGAAVLEDPTGRRRRRLRIASRLVALVLTAWLIALVLGGVGLSPVPGIPFAHVLRPATPPPAERHPPVPAQPSASDLAPAVPATRAGTAAPVSRPRRTQTAPASAHRPAQTPTYVVPHTPVKQHHAPAPAGTKPTSTAPANAPGHTQPKHANNG